MKKITTLFISAISLLVLTGCKVTNVNAYERAQQRSTPNIIEDQRVETDVSLRRVASLVRLNEGTTEGGNLRVQADVMNQTNKTHTVLYKFEWFDQEGILMESIGGWRAIRVSGGETVSLLGISPSDKAVDFRVKLRES